MAFGLPAGGLEVAGHKIPWPAIGALAGVAGVVLVLRARSQGSQVVATGAAPVLPDQASVGVLGQGQEAQLANLSQQLASLQGTIASQAATPPPVPPPAPPPPPPAPAPLPVVIGSMAGTDAGWYFGAGPSSVPQGEQLQWRYTSAFLARNPLLGSAPAAGYGPPAGQPAPEYSWEWRVVPTGQIT